MVLVIASAALGCNTFKKVEQCNALIDKINAAQQAAQQLDSAGEASTEELKKLAGILEQLSKDIQGMQLENGQLRQHANEYQKMVVEMAAASRKLIAAVDAEDAAKASSAKAQMDAVSAQEDALVARINAFCGAQ
jgi:chromosome segregation ATPase